MSFDVSPVKDSDSENKTFCALVVMKNGFALNHYKSLQIYFFYVKRRAKNNFLKDVKSTVWCLIFRVDTVDILQGMIYYLAATG